jgi:hypothetical protein
MINCPYVINERNQKSEEENMGLFDFIRKKNTHPTERRQLGESPVVQVNTRSGGSPDQRAEVDFARIISDEERELVAVVTSAVLAGSNDSSHMRVRNVTGIDLEKEIAAAIVGAIASGDHPNSQFRLKSIARID